MTDESKLGVVVGPVIANYVTTNDSKFVDKRYANIKSDVLEITHDKLENILLKFYEKHLLRSAWLNPFSLAAGVALTLLTADFKPTTFGVEGPVWKAIFIVVLIGSLGWFAATIVRLVLNWKETSLESLIDRIKNRNEDSK